MVIAKVRVNSVSAETVFCSHVPKDAIGCKVAFEFTDRAWDGLNKTVVFRNSDQTLDTVLEENHAIIPHELLSTVMDSVYVGIYGTDVGQNLAIPTVWTKLGKVDSAANPSGDTATDPSLPYWAQILGEVETMRADMMTQEDLENTLAQIKESGEFDGPQGEKGDTGEQGPQGEKGDPGVDGVDGVDGYTPVRGTDYWTEDDQNTVITEASQKVLGIVSKSSDIICTASGEKISIADASDRELQGLQLFGKTTQNGTPTPENLVALDRAGDSGNISVNIGISETDENPQTLTVSTPNGLPGIPVSSDGTYTDEDGQQWICDEIDLERGVYIQRIGTYTTNSATKWYANGNNSGIGSKNLHVYIIVGTTLNRTLTGILCDRFTYYKHTGAANETLTNVSSNFVGQGTIVFDIDKTITDTLDAWVAYAAENPVTIQYILADPVETPVTDEVLSVYSQLHTNYPSTTIYNDAGAGIAVKYVADIKLYIDNKYASLINAAQEVSSSESDTP